MFDIGFLEMMTIGIVALVVIGPERLPDVAKKVGHYVGKAQRFVRGVRSDISRELETGDLKKLIGDQKSQIDELREMMHTATKDVQSSAGDALKDAEKSISDLKNSASSVSENSTDVSRVDKDPELLNDAGVTTPAPAAEDSTSNTQTNDKAS